MTFNELVEHILNEAGGVDPMKFAYKGGPMGFRKDTGVSNPEKFVPDSPSRKMYDPSSADAEKRAKSGEYIEQDIHRMLRIALLVTASDPDAGAELQRVLENFSIPYNRYRADIQQYRTLAGKLEKTGSTATIGQKVKRPEMKKNYFQNYKPTDRRGRQYIDWLEDEMEKFEKSANEHKQQFEALTPDTINAVHDLVREGGKKFFEKISEEQQKSIEQEEGEVYTSADRKGLEFLKDIWRGQSEFVPLTKFAEVETENGKNPVARLLTIYKSVLDSMTRNNLVGSPERTLNFITGKVGQTRSLHEPTKGRAVMKQKDAGLFRVINLLKAGKYQAAKDAVNATKLESQDKADLMINIDKLSKGEMTEADVIRPLYAF